MIWLRWETMTSGGRCASPVYITPRARGCRSSPLQATMSAARLLLAALGLLLLAALTEALAASQQPASSQARLSLRPPIPALEGIPTALPRLQLSR